MAPMPSPVQELLGLRYSSATMNHTAWRFPKHSRSYSGKEKYIVLHFLVDFQKVLKSFSSFLLLVAQFKVHLMNTASDDLPSKNGSAWPNTFRPVISLSVILLPKSVSNDNLKLL